MAPPTTLDERFAISMACPRQEFGDHTDSRRRQRMTRTRTVALERDPDRSQRRLKDVREFLQRTLNAVIWADTRSSASR
jgi:hypothetical protein